MLIRWACWRSNSSVLVDWSLLDRFFIAKPLKRNHVKNITKNAKIMPSKSKNMESEAVSAYSVVATPVVILARKTKVASWCFDWANLRELILRSSWVFRLAATKLSSAVSLIICVLRRSANSWRAPILVSPSEYWTSLLTQRTVVLHSLSSSLWWSWPLSWCAYRPATVSFSHIVP